MSPLITGALSTTAGSRTPAGWQGRCARGWRSRPRGRRRRCRKPGITVEGLDVELARTGQWGVTDESERLIAGLVRVGIDAAQVDLVTFGAVEIQDLLVDRPVGCGLTGRAKHEPEAPSPPVDWSMPALPNRLSLPLSPNSLSSPARPHSSSLPARPRISPSRWCPEGNPPVWCPRSHRRGAVEHSGSLDRYPPLRLCPDEYHGNACRVEVPWNFRGNPRHLLRGANRPGKVIGPNAPTAMRPGTRKSRPRRPRPAKSGRKRLKSDVMRGTLRTCEG